MVDIDTYRSFWKNNQNFTRNKLTERDIQRFMQSESKGIMGLFKKGLVFDIVFKLVLTLSLFALLILTSGQPSWGFILVLILITVSGIFWQISTLRKLPGKKPEGQNLLELLKEFIGFNYRYYINSLLVGALSSSVLFLCGSLFYFYFKYQGFPPFEVDDYLVLGVGIVLSYGFSAAAQLKQNAFQIRQLEQCQKEIEENLTTSQNIQTFRRRKRRNILVVTISLIAGVLLLMFLIYSI